VIAQLPALTKLTVAPLVPLVVQTPVVVEVKPTARPEDALAFSVTVPPGVKTCAAGGVKAMVCVP
jgi:hypothetical protein